jgi:hypothetical protein
MEDCCKNISNSEAIFCINEGNSPVGAFRITYTFIPGYSDKILRIRHILMSPSYEYGEKTVEDYGRVLSGIVLEAVKLTDGDYRSQHIKLHMRSIADRQFFQFFADSAALPSATGISIQVKGSWLHIDKA